MNHAGAGVDVSPTPSPRLYLYVFLALCGLTAVSVVADFLHLADWRVLAVIVLAVAFAKALCVMMYFMHLRFESHWKYLLLAPTLILAASLPVSLMPDIGMHYYPADTPQSQRRADMSADSRQADEPVRTGHAHPGPEAPPVGADEH